MTEPLPAAVRSGRRRHRTTLRWRLTLVFGGVTILVGIVLLAARGAVVSAEELLDRVWDENADPFTTTVRVTVMTLRRKLGEPALVETVVGAGYRVPAAGDAAAAG